MNEPQLDSISNSNNASYRNGTIMGLTAAEAFMLISFILLLLLAWRFIADEESQTELKSAQTEVETLRKFNEQFSKKQMELALKYRNQLPEIHRNIEIINYVVGANVTLEKLQRGLDWDNQLGNRHPDIAEERLRLMDNDRLRKLLESVSNLPEKELLQLTNMTSTENLAKKLQKFEEFDQSGITVEAALSQREKEKQLNKVLEGLKNDLRIFKQLGLTPEQINDLQQGHEKLREELGIFKQLGLTPEQINDLQRNAIHTEDLRQGQEKLREEIVEQFRGQIGPKIKPLGGQIRDNGNIIFPEKGLFETGSAIISPRFNQTLQGICRYWFEVLYSKKRHLDTIQIEGHASSEYGEKKGREAFDLNLDLSQKRASAVFKRCLDFGGNDNVASWAQSNLVAVGFSSARIITKNGVEDRRTSRRVEFAIGMKPLDNTDIGN